MKNRSCWKSEIPLVENPESLWLEMQNLSGWHTLRRQSSIILRAAGNLFLVIFLVMLVILVRFYSRMMRRMIRMQGDHLKVNKGVMRITLLCVFM